MTTEESDHYDERLAAGFRLLDDEFGTDDADADILWDPAADPEI